MEKIRDRDDKKKRGGEKSHCVVLGIDPGFGSLGYAVLSIEGGVPRAVDYGCLKTVSSTAFPARIAMVYCHVIDLAKKHRPARIAIEKLFFEKNTKTAIDVAHARGVIVLAAHHAAVPIVECAPLQVKMAVTGYGKADKRQVQEMMKRILGLSHLPKQDDAADALAIAYCGITL